MSSLVSEFIINPVLRQARRFSEISRSTFAGDRDEAPEHPPEHHEAVIESSPLQSPVVEAFEAFEDQPVPESPPLTRPLSISTEETRVGETFSSPTMAEASPPQRSAGLLISPLASKRIPEDDGMRLLRSRIQAINAQDISSSEKARLMHDLLLEGYLASQSAPSVKSIPKSSESPPPSSDHHHPHPSVGPLKFWQSESGEPPSSENFVLSADDIKPTYVPVKQSKSHGHEVIAMSPDHEEGQQLGCQHYARNVKLECSTCHKWYTCRFCHDAQEDHNLIRNETKNMLCMLCATPQEASDVCNNCGEIAAHYFCNICKLWENRQGRPVYHCNDCGICRRGFGLGKDFFHCKTCRACISMSIETSHKCIERSTDCDCPICGEYLFTSPRPVVFMKCGHSIHKKCYDQHEKVSYKCPICNKSLRNMESQFRNLDVAIQAQPMPSEFCDTTAVILCNDCSGKSTVRYHWLGLKCSICRSYNTVELKILGPDHRQVQPTITETGEPVDAAAESQATEVANANANAIPIPTPIPIPIPTQTTTRANSTASGRRRHSSHFVEGQFSAPDRVAHSLSPLNLPLSLGFDSLLGLLSQGGEPDDDIFGIWRGRDLDSIAGDSEAEDDGSEGASDTDEDGDEDEEEEEEEDEDDPNEIFLIGHR